MRIFNKLFKLRHHQVVEECVLTELFSLERSTLVSLILLETIFLYILLPLIGSSIVVWYGIIVTLTLWRLYDAYDFKKNPHRHTFLEGTKKVLAFS